MQLNPNLTFNGQCEAAFKVMMTYENTPMHLQTTPNWREKVDHAAFGLGHFIIYGSDVPPERYQAPQGLALQLNLRDRVEVSVSSKAWRKTGLFKCDGSIIDNVRPIRKAVL